MPTPKLGEKGTKSRSTKNPSVNTNNSPEQLKPKAKKVFHMTPKNKESEEKLRKNSSGEREKPKKHFSSFEIGDGAKQMHFAHFF